MTVLVTGASGFSGTALIRHLIDQGERDICGIARGALPAPLLKAGIRSVQCDLLDASRIRKVMEDINPDHIIHLAALNRGTLAELLNANAVGTRNLLDAVDAANPACQTLIVSSSAVYGYPGRDPIGEGTPLLPLSDYGVSKAAQEHVALMHHAITGAPIAIARPFNLVGPGQPDSLICGRIVRQVVEIERGQSKHLELQETWSYRDFIDVRDTVRAYRALVSHPDFNHACSGTIFNIGSGTAHAVSDVISLVENTTGRRYVVTLPENPPRVPIPYQQGDSTLIKKVTGWHPKISLKDSLADMLAETRSGKTE
jgi:GDP-4-dehydro-6-deoxy-D-mannose reductase